MADSVSDKSSLLSGWLSLLGNRLLLALLAVSLIPLALTGIAMYRSSADSLRKQTFNQLETVRTITAKSVQRYFAGLQDQLRVASEDRMTVDALRQFKAAVATLAADTKADEKSLTATRRGLETFYTGEFTNEYRRRNGSDVDAKPLGESLDDVSAILQDLYIRRNPNPIEVTGAVGEFQEQREHRLRDVRRAVLGDVAHRHAPGPRRRHVDDVVAGGQHADEQIGRAHV